MFDFEKANEMLQANSNENEIIDMNSPEFAVKSLNIEISVQPLVLKAEKYEVANVEEAMQALSMALQARKLATALIDSKKEITKPQIDYQKAVNKLVEDYTNKLKKIEENLKDKIEKWIDQSADLAYASGLEGIQVEDGSLKRVNKWDFRILDERDVPREYLQVDVAAIEKDIKSGVREIPGVEIYLKQETKLRVKN